MRRSTASLLHATLTLATCLRIVVFSSDISVAAAASFNGEKQPIAQEVLSANDLLAQTNEQRVSHGLQPLQLNSELTAAAQAKAQDMLVNHYWDHFRPNDHKAPWDFIDESGYNYRVAGENLARGFRTSKGITDAWMASPAHRANLLSPKYSDVGFATVYSYNDQGQRVILTVQMFGSR